MPKLQQTYINDPDKQVRIVLNGRGHPGCILPARLERIAMRGASLLVDGPTVPAEGVYVSLALGYPTPILYASGKMWVEHLTAEGSQVVWMQFDDNCRGEPLHRARDLIKALR